MHHVFLSLLLLAVCLSSLPALAIDRNGKFSAMQNDGKFEDDDDLVLDDREAREIFSNGNFHFNDVGKTDNDLFFDQEDDKKWKNKNSVDYSEWERSNGLKLNGEEEEVEEEKGVIKKLIQKFKNLLHKLGKRR